MTDPYRSSPFPCPECQTGLREFGSRLVCDGCEGILFEDDDLAAQIGATNVVEVVESGGDTALACPRCYAKLRAAALRINKLRFDYPLGHCEDDGVWVPRAVLEDVLARMSRSHSHGGFGTNNRPAGYLKLFDPTAHKQRPTPVPTSAFKDRRLPCPVCSGVEIAIALDRWPCASCGGTFVENDALVAMVSAMTGAPWQLPPPTGDEGARPCPICGVAMRTEPLEDVPIDRCPEHGIWFDPAELGDALRHASGIDEPRGLGGWLKRLF